MTAESWFKICLPGLPTAFTLLGVWGYWHENPLPLLAPNIGFWGVVIAFYLFTHMSIPGNRGPFFLAIITSLLWLISAMTGHNLANFIASKDYSGFETIISRTDFWYTYVFSLIGFGLALWLFIKHEPRIASQAREERAKIQAEA